MIHSMTGYGRKSEQTEAFSVTVEMKSVNHRFSEISIFLPRPFFMLEEKIKRLAAKSIDRGKVDIYVIVEGSGLSEQTLAVDWDLLSQYILAIRQAKKHHSLPGEVSAGELLQIEDVFSVQDSHLETDKVENVLLKAVRDALDQLIEMRKEEGRHLEEDLVDRLDYLESSLVVLRDRIPMVVEHYRERLRERMEDYLSSHAELDEERLLNEVAVYSDKADVHEEITRLESHISQFRKYLRDGGVIGKKLNFLQQEMNREANTIGAKGNDFKIRMEVVEMKSELEKIKEQIQNIE